MSAVPGDSELSSPAQPPSGWDLGPQKGESLPRAVAGGGSPRRSGPFSQLTPCYSSQPGHDGQDTNEAQLPSIN